ncbi:hypothetical protein LKO27_13440 [Tessaracoccus sp. OS52]|uniref:hypothetical protein n=1 Tax=Tessaracoccus sp. OS52 TaxID=2886691 RepID=UPI001D12DD9C|nr:hypothetical protein [Tessaracoccus sp. OS52]MCC2594407.1 hypothetical protein [Tessaracoccus sp. OS52]
MPRRQTSPSQYELRVLGHLEQRWSDWFDGLTVTAHDDGTTTIRGEVRDQAQLHGLIGRIRDLGAPLVSVNPVAKAQ